MRKKQVLAISGSTRKSSANGTILTFISESFRKELDIRIYEGVDLLPHFNPDLDTDNPPPVVSAFRQQIQQADGILICSPEYVFSLPGSLKNALDWNVSTTLFSNKPVALIVAAASGEKALESLDLIMTTIESRIAAGSKLLISGARGKIGADGKIRDSRTAERIREVVHSLMRSMQEKNAVPTKYRNL